jgi:deoxyribonuclease-2
MRAVCWFVLVQWTLLATAAITCLDENANAVDWWVILKLPHLASNANSVAASGYGYAYADSNSPSIQFTNKRLDQNLNGALGSTLNQIYNNIDNNIAWLMWNDETPDEKEHDSYGHTKGDLAFDSNTGFHLVHSVPRFPVVTGGDPYNYPSGETEFGQSFLCLSLTTSTFDTIGSLLLYNKPFVYDSNLPPSIAQSVPNIKAVLNSKWVKSPGTSAEVVKTYPSQYPFTVFAKNAQWAQYLYENFTEPYFGEDMLWETWRNGAADLNMPTFCKPTCPYDSININNIQLTSTITWSKTQDHSKWGISWSQHAIYCIGDINRQFSQAKRGGGTVCGNNSSLWKSFMSMIANNDTCPQ